MISKGEPRSLSYRLSECLHRKTYGIIPLFALSMPPIITLLDLMINGPTLNLEQCLDGMDLESVYLIFLLGAVRNYFTLYLYPFSKITKKIYELPNFLNKVIRVYLFRHKTNVVAHFVQALELRGNHYIIILYFSRFREKVLCT